MPFQLNKTEKLEITMGPFAQPSDIIRLAIIQVESVWLEKAQK